MLLRYSDIKYYKPFSAKEIKLSGSIAYIPIIDIFQEAEIIDLTIEDTLQNISVDILKNKDMIEKIYRVIFIPSIKIITNQDKKSVILRTIEDLKLLSQEDILTLYYTIYMEYTYSMMIFFHDEKVKEYLARGCKFESSEMAKTPDDDFIFTKLVVNVLSHINIPEKWLDKFSLKSFILIQRAINDNQETDRFALIPYLSETGKVANYGMDWRKANEKPYENIIDNYNKRMGIKQNFKSGDGLFGIMQIIKNVEQISVDEYLEQKRKEYEKKKE
ncbi:MAG: hypothetical protein PHP92_05550 [Candidatus Nanoarchaeia archaeon]|nr:hypothetical protein [Candidatus Nanoarchaeia archaeon]